MPPEAYYCLQRYPNASRGSKVSLEAQTGLEWPREVVVYDGCCLVLLWMFLDCNEWCALRWCNKDNLIRGEPLLSCILDALFTTTYKWTRRMLPVNLVEVVPLLTKKVQKVVYLPKRIQHLPREGALRKSCHKMRGVICVKSSTITECMSIIWFKMRWHCNETRSYVLRCISQFKFSFRPRFPRHEKNGDRIILI